MTRWLTVSTAVGFALFLMGGTAGAAEPFPPFNQPVVDAAGLVPDAIERSVGAELSDYQARSGTQIAVAVVNSTGSRSIEDQSIDLARRWGVGQKDEDSGILLVIASRDRKVRLEVGRGLEGEFTDLQSGSIVRDRLVPLLKAGDVGAAVVQGTKAIRKELGATQVGALVSAPDAGNGGRNTSSPWLYLGALVIFGALAEVARRRGRGGHGRGGHGRGTGRGDGIFEAAVWGAALTGLGGSLGGVGVGVGGGGGFGGGGASGGW